VLSRRQVEENAGGHENEQVLCSEHDGGPILCRPHLGDGTAQAKLAASFTSPAPRYCATCGYGHSGRVSGFEGSSVARPVPTRCCGAVPCSTHRSSAVKISCSGSRVLAPPP